MAKLTTLEYDLPSYLASYLINGDDSGIDEKEVRKFEKFREQECLGECLSISENEEFMHGNDMNNVGGNCLTYTFRTIK